MALAVAVFTLAPASAPQPSVGNVAGAMLMADMARRSAVASGGLAHRAAYETAARGFVGEKVPLGLKRKGLRVVVTGGAGFVGSHLVDRLMARGDSVIVIDNFFTGRKENVMHHFGNSNADTPRRRRAAAAGGRPDLPLACPASPVHYKFNLVKTIIPFDSI